LCVVCVSGAGSWVRLFAAEAVAFLFRSAPDAALPAGVRALLQEVDAPPPESSAQQTGGRRRRAAEELSRDERVAASAQVIHLDARCMPVPSLSLPTLRLLLPTAHIPHQADDARREL